MRITPLAGAALAAAVFFAPAALPQQNSTNELRPPSAFASIADRAARSRALFAEVVKVPTSPRCMNCHPAGDHPTQGDGDPYRDPRAMSTPTVIMSQEYPGETRAVGLRRLSKLTWRTTQLSAVTAVGLVTLFARTAPAQTTSQTAPTPSTQASMSAAATHAAARRHHRHAGAGASSNPSPTAQAGQSASGCRPAG